MSGDGIRMSGRDAGEQKTSREDLNEYIHAARPGLVVVIIALLVLSTAVIVWGFTGTLPVTETVTGLVIDKDSYLEHYHGEDADRILKAEDSRNMILCFVDASRFNGQAIKEFGDEAVIKMADQNVLKGKINTRYRVPISMEEAADILLGNEWVLEQCVKQNYNWLLLIEPNDEIPQYAFTLAEVTLLTEEVKPIRFLLK
jgi:hypothetical protein